MKLFAAKNPFTSNTKQLAPESEAVEMQAMPWTGDFKPAVADLEEGPRNMQIATMWLHVILDILAREQPANVLLSADPLSGDSYLRVSSDDDDDDNGEDPINVSLVLRHANVSHVVLSDDQVLNLARYQQSAKWNTVQSQIAVIPKDNVFSFMPRPMVDAITMYTSNEYHAINQFFRGQEYEPKSELSTMEWFITGILATVALNRIPHLLAIHPECSWMQLSEYMRLNRYEVFTDDEIMRHRVGLVNSPQLLSTSTAPRSSLELQQIPTTVSIASISLYPSEQEVLAPMGQQYLFRQENKKSIGRVVSTPMLDDYDHFAVGKVLSYVYQNFFSQPYVDEPQDKIVINRTLIYRSNHGLAMIMQHLASIKAVVALFAKHALDPDLRSYCQNMTNAELTLLANIAAFNNTGRQSEISHAEHPARYAAYRMASAENFRVYARANLPLSSAEIDEATILILQRGNRQFVSNRIHVLEMIHNLNLKRCYSEDNYQAVLELHAGDLTDNCEEDLKLVSDFVAAMMDAMGEASPWKGRRAPFDLFSTKVAICDLALQHVPNGIPSTADTARFVKVLRSFSNWNKQTKVTGNLETGKGVNYDNIQILLKDIFPSEAAYTKAWQIKLADFIKEQNKFNMPMWDLKKPMINFAELKFESNYDRADLILTGGKGIDYQWLHEQTLAFSQADFPYKLSAELAKFALQDYSTEDLHAIAKALHQYVESGTNTNTTLSLPHVGDVDEGHTNAATTSTSLSS